MLSRRVGRACYSTNITQDFINDLLARAKEATTQTPRKSQNKFRPQQGKNNNNGKYSQSGERRPRTYYNRRFNRNDGDQRGPTSRGEVMTNSNGNSAVTLDQPQFSDKKSTSSDSIDLIDIIQDQPKKNTQYKRPNSQRRKGDSKNNRISLRSTNSQYRQKKISIDVKSEDYHPEDVSPASLLKYSPNLYYTQLSRLYSFALTTLKDSNFPTYRQPNMTTQKLLTPLGGGNNSFGKYIPANSLILQKERQLKNLEVDFDQSKYIASVKGKYFVLPTLTAKSFESISKNETSQENFVKNSNIVKLALQNNVDLNKDADKISLIYEVCSGLKPLSNLNNAK